MLKQRIITALILIPIALAVLFFLPPQYFFMLTALIALVGAWEWCNLLMVKKKSARFLYLFLIALTLLGAAFVPVTLIFILAFIWWIVATVLIVLYPRATRWAQTIYWRAAMGIVVLVPCWAAINYIRNQADGTFALLFLFILIWGADSVAYFAGKKWGKTKLAPNVSPGKSIQGAGAALIFSIIFTMAILWFNEIPLRFWTWAIFLSVITIVFSIIGDLFESMLKRQVNLKDSSRLLPGHGGLLDRIDSLTAAAPVFALGAIVLGEYVS